jgi:LCP family protein required for cell wall assembly
VTAAERRRRSWPQRLLIAFNLALMVLCLTGAGGLGFLYYRFGQLPRIALANGVLAPEQSSGEPQNFLLVGSDSRAFVDAGTDDAEGFGTTSQVGDKARADTIILVRVDPRSRQAAMVSFPRDLWLPIAGRSYSNRINTAFEDGPDQLIETIKQNFNVPIHHYAQVDFKGFQALVDAIGTVTIYLSSPVRDPITGLNVTDTGCVPLPGDMALAYVRSRHFEYQENGKWRTDPTGDLGRIERQQDFIRRAIKEALSRGLTNPVKLNKLVNVGINHVQISKSLDVSDIVSLGRNFKSLAPDTLHQFRLPVTGTRHGAASTLDILPKDKVAADRIFDVFRGVLPPAADEIQPSGVRVRVLNGSGVTGAAGDAVAALEQAKFGVTQPGDSRRTARTVIRYAEGQEAKARLLERYLKAGADVEQQAGLSDVDTVLVIGTDFAGILAEPRSVDSVETASGEATPPTAAPDC